MTTEAQDTQQWFADTVEMVVQQGYRVTPIFKGGACKPYGHGETHPDISAYDDAVAVGVVLDECVLCDWDGNHADSAGLPITDLETLAAKLGLETMPECVQEGSKGRSLHFLFNRGDRAVGKCSADGWLDFVDIKTGNQIMALKPGKIITDSELPAKGDLLPCPEVLLEALSGRRTGDLVAVPNEQTLGSAREDIRLGKNLHDSARTIVNAMIFDGKSEPEIYALFHGELAGDIHQRDAERVKAFYGAELRGLIESGFKKYGDRVTTVADFEVITDGPQHPLTIEWNGDPGRKATFLIDGILCADLSLLAAYPGTGKTTALATLSLIVAGLMDVEGLPVKSRRNVVFVSEHPQQVAQILEATCRAQFIDHYRDRIKIVEAERMPVERIVQADWSDFAVEHTRNGISKSLLPWVILDTTSAVIEAENENDNSEMSSIVAAIKSKLVLKGYPVTLCTHTSKQHKNSLRANEITARGASAWEGDVMQVMYLLKDDEDGPGRSIHIAEAKHRFREKAYSLQVTPHVSTLMLTDEWGDREHEDILWCSLMAMDKSQHDAMKEMCDEAREEAKEERKRTQEATRRQDILDAVRQHGPVISKEAIFKIVRGNREAFQRSITALISEGEIVEGQQGRNATHILPELGGR